MIQINNELRDRAYQCACRHGFHDKEYSDAHWLMLIITEISEAVNADKKERHAHANTDVFKECLKHSISYNGDNESDKNKTWYVLFEKEIKDTVEDEISDVVIRYLDFAGLKNIDINPISPNFPCWYDKDESTFTEYMFDALRDLIIPPITLIGKYQINRVISAMFEISDKLGVDLFWHIEQKMKYNEMRPKLNGKKY